MIPNYYNLREQPFGATPDSRYLFESAAHREALASLLYGINAGRGFFALIAKPGMGKTTLLFRTLSHLKGNAKTVFLFQTICTPLDFLRALLADLGIEQVNGNIVELQSKLTKILLQLSRRGERLVVVIDEAQNLEDSVLELIRMLSNFETSKEKLMQIILSGQPDLATKLASPKLIQLRQRISIVAQLHPFSSEQTAAYVEHRLRVAGWKSDQPLFSAAALHLIAEHSEGIPRNINNLCFNSISIGCALKRKKIDREIVQEVIRDLDLDRLTDRETTPAETKPRLKAKQDSASKHRIGAWLPRALAASVIMVALSGSSIERVEGPALGSKVVRSRQGAPVAAPVGSEIQPANISPPPSSITLPFRAKPRLRPQQN